MSFSGFFLSHADIFPKQTHRFHCPLSGQMQPAPCFAGMRIRKPDAYAQEKPFRTVITMDENHIKISIMITIQDDFFQNYSGKHRKRILNGSRNSKPVMGFPGDL